jgi:hypothetical protein
MKKLMKVAGIALMLPLVASALSGCRRGDAAEIAQEDIAEAIANQAISTYNQASIDVTVNDKTVGFNCTQGGTLTWAELDSSGEICYVTTSNGCTMAGRYGSITLSGDYSVCGFPATYQDGSVQDLDGKTLYIEGDIQAASANHTSRTCSYDLELTTISITGDGSSLTFTSGVSGTMCGDRGFESELSFTIAGSVELEESAE